MKQISKYKSFIRLFLIFAQAILASFTLSNCTRDEIPLTFIQNKQESNKEEDENKNKTPDNEAREENKDVENQTYFFAQGVSKEKGWYDVDKLKRPEDIMACWLISASNMLQWWQDRYIAQGYSLPEGTPNGIGDGLYKLEIFDNAIKNFRDLKKGGNISSGLMWYIEGKKANLTGHSYPVPNSGGYLKSLINSCVEYKNFAFTTFGDWEEKKDDAEVITTFSNKLLDKLEKGAALGLEIKTQVGLGGSLHAITLWGVEIDSKKEITHLYITDSDDYERQLVCCPINVYNNDSFNTKTKDVIMHIPPGKAYTEGCTWTILRAYYLAPPKKVQ